MRRATLFYVGGEDAKFTKDEWNKLRAALRRFGEHFYKTTVRYKGGDDHVETRPYFWVGRDDHRPLTSEEITALSWYFYGVCIAHNINPKKE